jgi:hypothetical protein
MQNIDEERTANSGDEISVYNIVVTDNGTHNDGFRDKSLILIRTKRYERYQVYLAKISIWLA